MLKKVISGGQTGADIAALRAAKACGIATGGWMPKDWITERVAHPEYAELYGMREHVGNDYPPRTVANVLDADATLIFSRNHRSHGSLLTKELCEKHGKAFKMPVMRTYRVDECIAWLDSFKEPIILNVAGNRESVARGIEIEVEAFLTQVFKRCERD